MAAFLESHPPSVAAVDFHFKDVADEPTCQRIMDTALFYVNFFSRLYPLHDLDGITYARDYANTLATLDRGFETETTLTATSDSVALGVAMAPAVKRDGKLKTHVVISAIHRAS